MSIRSLLTTGLLASVAFAAPGKRDDNTTTVTKTKTVTSTKTKTTTSKITKTTTEKITKTTTEKITKTSTETDTVTATITAAPVTVTRTASAAASTVTVAAPASTVTRTASATPSTVTVAGSASTVTVGATSTATIYTVAAPPATVTSTVTVTLGSTASQAAGATPTSTSQAAGATPTTTATGTTSSVNTSGTITLTATSTSTATGLADAAKARGLLYFGTAADIPGTGEAQDYFYMTQFNNTHDFNEVTPANTMKWFATEPQQGVFDYTGANTFLSIVKPTKQFVRCHNLVWKSQLSSWVTSPSTPWTNATLSAALYNHAYTLVSHFGDTCHSWDVVNEAFTDSNPSVYDNSSIFNQIIGPSYVMLAFQAATKAVRDNNLKVKLVYNDYNIESPNSKTNATLALVKQIKDAGLQIDVVGFESHFIVGSAPSKAGISANIQAFAAAGVDVTITELDIRTVTPPTLAAQNQQVTDYYNAVSACVSNVASSAGHGCDGIVLWDFVDTYSWIPGFFKGQGYALPWFQPGGANTTLVKKSIYDGILRALNGQ